MMAAWMVYCLAVALLLGGAAVAAEYVLRLYGRSVRWIWAGALLGSVGMPALAYFLASTGRSGASLGNSGLLLPLLVQISGGESDVVPLGGGRGALEWLTRFDGVLMWLWLLSTAVLAALWVLSWLRMRRHRAAWREASGENGQVWIAPDRGPAVVGVVRGQVVLPAWMLELEREFREAVLLHEREHLRVGDHRLQAAALGILLLLPWNPAVWWLLRRLRLALEYDCDARVIARGVPVATYGELLVAVGARQAGRWAGLASFAEPKTFLEKRVRAMTETLPKKRTIRALPVAAATVLLVGLACETPAPAETEQVTLDATVTATENAGPVGESGGQVAGGADEGGPAFIPYDTPPRLQNLENVKELLKANYPEELRVAGVGGEVAVWLNIDTDGTVRQVVVKEGSGRPELDEAAVRVAEGMRFTPARNEGKLVSVWVMQPIIFQAPRKVSLQKNGKDGTFEVSVGARSMVREANERADNPLIFVDGQRVKDPLIRHAEEGKLTLDGLNGLTPDDIERIEVIKGTEALNRFGPEAVDGVILITTKSGG